MQRGLIADSPFGRTVWLGGLMLLLFVGSLLLAWTLTGAPLRDPTPLPPHTVTLAGATVNLPASWGLETSRVSDDGSAGDWFFVNTARPSERLRVLRLTASPQASVQQIASQVLPRMVGARRLINAPSYEVANLGSGQKLEMIFSLQRLTSVASAAGASPQISAVIVVTPDQQRFWLFQLTDQISREVWEQYQQDRQLEVQSLAQLRHILSGAVFGQESADK